MTPTPDPLYRVKPLVWEELGSGAAATDPLFRGRFAVYRPVEFGGWPSVSPGGWQWYYYCSGDTQDGGPCDSLADGKAKAESWYRDRLLAALEPVPDTVQTWQGLTADELAG